LIHRDGHREEIIAHLVDVSESYSYYHGAVHAVIKKQTYKGFQGIAEIRRDGIAK